MSGRTLSNVLGLVGAAVGGALGFLLVGLLSRRGLYAVILPGALLGLGCNLLARHRSTARGLVCAVAGLILGVLAEWANWPFGADRSLRYFVAHLHRLDRGWAAYAMFALGAAFAYWWGSTAHFPRPLPVARAHREVAPGEAPEKF